MNGETRTIELGDWASSSAPPRPRVSQSGFSLIEVAMAIVVISVGVLAMFGLMTAGLDASSKSVSETQSAQFAANVMNAIRAKSLQVSKSNVDTNSLDKWQLYWKDFSTYKQQLELPGWKAYSKSPIYIRATRPNETISLALTNLTFRGGSETNAMINLGLRYQLNVNLMKEAPEGYNLHTKDIDIPDYFTIVGITLTVWDGLFGVPNYSDAMIFYSEVNNPGTL